VIKKFWAMLFSSLNVSILMGFHPLNSEAFLSKKHALCPSLCKISFYSFGHGSGSLIKKESGQLLLITAAHVANVAREKPSNIQCNGIEMKFSPGSIRIHPERLADLAIIPVVPLEEHRVPVAVTLDSAPLIENKNELLWVAGYGQTYILTRIVGDTLVRHKDSIEPVISNPQMLGMVAVTAEHPFGNSNKPLAFLTRPLSFLTQPKWLPVTLPVFSADDLVALTSGDSGAGLYRKDGDGKLVLVAVVSGGMDFPQEKLEVSGGIPIKSLIVSSTAIAPYISWILTTD